MQFLRKKWVWPRLAAGLVVAPLVGLGVVWGVPPGGVPSPQVGMPQPTASDPRALLREAKSAIDTRDYARAEQLILQAEAANPSGKWGLLEDSPASLRKKLASAKAEANKKEVTRLMSEARAVLALPARNEQERVKYLEEALKIARQADALHGPEYSLWETGDRPDRLVRDVEAALAQMRSRVPAPPALPSVQAAQDATRSKPPMRLPAPPNSPAAAGTSATSSAAAPGAIPATGSPAGMPQPPQPSPAGVSGGQGVAGPAMPLPPGNALPAPMTVEPGLSKGGPASSAPAELPLPPAPPAPLVMAPPAPADVNKSQAEKLIAEAKALASKGDFVAARQKLRDAEALKVPYPENEGPAAALRELVSLGQDVKSRLVQEAKECVSRSDWGRAEAALGGAEQIAKTLELPLAEIEQARSLLAQARSQTPASPATPGAPAPLPALVIAPPATPALRNPVAPNSPVASPASAPTAAPAAPETGSAALTGQQLLQQAKLELQKGDFAMATAFARKAYNLGDVKPQAQALMNEIDAEAFKVRKKEAERAFENAVRSFATRDYAATLGALALVDPKLLPDDKRAKRDELMKTCQSALDGTQPGVRTVSAQTPSDAAGGAPAPGPMPAVGGPSLPVSDPPLMKVDPLASGSAAKPEGDADPSKPTADARQAQAEREIVMQKLHEEGLKAMRDAQSAFSAGDTDLAINILNDYAAKVRSSSLDSSRIALLLRPIDSRLNTFRLMKGQVDSLTREQKDKQAAKELLASRAAAEEQRQAELARLTREYQMLVKEKHDYAAAERVALQMKQLDPDNPATDLFVHMAKTQRRVKEYEQIKDDKERFRLIQWNDAEKLGPPVTIQDPVAMNIERMLRHGRRGVDDPYQPQRTPATFEIEMKLERPVNVSFQQTPLNLAIKNIAEKIQVPVWFDENAIAAEGSASLEQPQSADFSTTPISAKNALAVLLEGAGLSYVIEHDMLKITTLKKSKGRLYTKVFSVADLVTPVPNFALPDYQNMSKILGRSAIDNPQALIAGGTVRNAVMGGGTPASTGIPWDPAKGTSGGKLESVPTTGNATTPGRTDAGLGTQFAGPMTKHEQLIKLVTGMVRPLTWDSAGGNGKIEYYDIGAALVVNQTADVIREVADLLDALRRLQDLAVAIEIRIVSLSETFFERMGVDFAVNIRTHNTRLEPRITGGGSDLGSIFRPDPFINSLNGIEGTTIGLTPAGTFTPDLNVPIRATSFQYAIPGFGNYPNNPGYNGGVSLGLAFLNDIQVYMFMEAAQGDRRQNIMQAPKITLFNGQTATISITDFAYFVTNVQVFSVNGQIVFVPQNTPLPIGTQGTFGGQIGVQAVVSADRRFVRITPTLSLQTISGALTPLFPVTTFITPVFEGGSQGQPIPFTQFLQQPSLATIDVQTTVVCPDGGTVLMGGFKYLAEGRNEFGPPFLSKIPYLNRLFKNVGIGRETRHLMLMITPRIIITAEEELAQTEGVRFPNQLPGAP